MSRFVRKLPAPLQTKQGRIKYTASMAAHMVSAPEGTDAAFLTGLAGGGGYDSDGSAEEERCRLAPRPHCIWLWRHPTVTLHRHCRARLNAEAADMDDGCFPHTTHRPTCLPQMGQIHSGAITNGTRSVGFGLGEAGAASTQNPGADVAGVSPVPVQMWDGWAESRCRWLRGA
jgi:hypothetical protein